jgi:SAM-dependent methyltransferase
MLTDPYFGRDLEAMSLGTNYSRWILGEFQPFMGSIVAEVGAGSGNLSQMLLLEGVKMLIAIEPSENMHCLLNEKFKGYPNIRVHRSTLKDLHQSILEQLDTIVYINVLEHIEKDGEELQYAQKSLKSGGYLCLFVPSLPLLYSEFDRIIGHHRRYTFNQLNSLVSNNGFNIIKIKYFDLLGIIPWYFMFVIMKKTLLKSHVKYYDRIVVPINKLLERIIHIPLGKNLLVVATKKT